MQPIRSIPLKIASWFLKKSELKTNILQNSYKIQKRMHHSAIYQCRAINFCKWSARFNQCIFSYIQLMAMKKLNTNFKNISRLLLKVVLQSSLYFLIYQQYHQIEIQQGGHYSTMLHCHWLQFLYILSNSSPIFHTVDLRGMPVYTYSK